MAWTLNTEHLFLDRIIVNEIIYDTIFDACSAKALVLLLRTCQTIHSSVKNYLKRAYNVERVLRRYFSDPMAFRYLQACTGALVSGSTALQFFDRSFYPESDLNVYVSMPWRIQLGQFLIAAGYCFEHDSLQHPDFSVAVSEPRVLTATAMHGKFKGIAGVFTFTRKQSDGSKLRVQIIVAVRSPVEVILRFPSSEFTFVI